MIIKRRSSNTIWNATVEITMMITMVVMTILMISKGIECADSAKLVIEKNDDNNYNYGRISCQSGEMTDNKSPPPQILYNKGEDACEPSTLDLNKTQEEGFGPRFPYSATNLLGYKKVN